MTKYRVENKEYKDVSCKERKALAKREAKSIIRKKNTGLF